MQRRCFFEPFYMSQTHISRSISLFRYSMTPHDRPIAIASLKSTTGGSRIWATNAKAEAELTCTASQ